MSARDLIQGDNLGNLESLPPCLECLIDRASSTDLSVSGNIVAADKEDSGVNKPKLPERNLRPRSIGCVGRDRAVSANNSMSLSMFAPKATSTT